jgi:hypothetical protein
LIRGSTARVTRDPELPDRFGGPVLVHRGQLATRAYGFEPPGCVTMFFVGGNAAAADAWDDIVAGFTVVGG